MRVVVSGKPASKIVDPIHSIPAPHGEPPELAEGRTTHDANAAKCHALLKNRT